MQHSAVNPLDQSYRKIIMGLPLFDPMAGTIIAQPPCNGEGCWAGGPSALYDAKLDRFLLSYRLRTTLRDHGRAGRGGGTLIAASSDGDNFDIVWKASKTDFAALSIEKSCLMQTLEGKFRLYVSYSAIADYRWRIDMMEADDPASFDPAKRVTVLDARATETEGVKDPVMIIVGGIWHLYVNMAPRPRDADFARIDRMHREGNCFVSGETACPTGLATSTDGIRFSWHGEVIPCGGDGWDAYLARISAIVYTPPFFTAVYDGRPNSGANYCDRPGFAISFDLQQFRKVDIGQGHLQSPYGRGTLRYMDVLRISNTFHYFYEIAREDGAHELRTVKIDG